MKKIDEIYAKLNHLIEEQKWDQVAPFLTGCMDQAKEENAHGMYVALGNELLSFYRETAQYESAFSLSDDILLLMEEFQQEHSENFAYIMINVASSYSGAGRPAEAESYYSRAVSILESPEIQITDESQQKYYDVYYVTALCGIAESAFQLGNLKKALLDFEKAAQESMKRNGMGEGTRILYENCASLADSVQDEERKQYYHDLLEKASFTP